MLVYMFFLSSMVIRLDFIFSAQHLYLFACCVLYYYPPASKRYRNLLTSLSKTHLLKGEHEERRERERGRGRGRLGGSTAVRKGGVMRATESPNGAGVLVIRENTAAHTQISHAVTGVSLQPLSLFLTCTLT